MQTVSIQLGQRGLEVFTPSPELVTADALGIELELEGFTPASTDEAARLVSPLWTIVPDGSLRNGGVEFITAGGLGGERLAAAINQLQGALEVVNYDASWRCSTHMHVNMLDFTVNQVVRFLLVYTACEPVLFNFCGAYRKSSNFCTPVIDSLPFHRKIMSRMWDDAVSRRYPMQHCNKYVALNLLPLFPDQRGRALGTVEFRGGRPLVTREEMFKQANLLLSIKDYVRNFAGTEEELLVSLTAGVHHTVYSNGVSAGLEPSVDDLERALVASWMLLKSYQEGLSSRTAHEEESVEDIPLRRPPRMMPLTPSHLANSMGDFTQLADLQEWIGRSTWPSMYEYHGQLTSNETPHQLLAAYQVLRSRNGGATIGWNNLQTAMLNWAGNLTPTSAEQTPIGTMIRLRNNVVMNPMHAEPHSQLPGPPAQGIRPAHICYQQLLGPERWAELLSRIGYNELAKNCDVWNYLANHNVRTKGRDSLNAALGEGGINVRVSEVMSTFKMYNLLRYTRRPSAGHVWSTDLPAYDNFCYVLDMLKSVNAHIPLLSVSGFGNTRLMWSKVDGAMCLDIPSSVYERSRSDQTVARTMTGVDIY